MLPDAASDETTHFILIEGCQGRFLEAAFTIWQNLHYIYRTNFCVNALSDVITFCNKSFG